MGAHGSGMPMSDEEFNNMAAKHTAKQLKELDKAEKDFHGEPMEIDWFSLNRGCSQ
jgi:hypothetical protein